ncbi:MAG: hypothetical protein ACXWT1_17450 [Methylobacter sp.]
MSDLEKILWTSAATIIGGVILFVIGQLLSKFLIEPIHELRKAVGEVRFSLAYYAPIIQTPMSRDKESSDKAYDAIMRNSCDLLTKADAIPFYRFLPQNLVLPISNIDGAAKDLRTLTTYLHQTGENADSNIEKVIRLVNKVENQLQIKALE